MQGDKAVIRDHLVDVGYYRLSGYWHIFKQEDNSFKPETTFEKVWNIYTFDRQLRLIVLLAIDPWSLAIIVGIFLLKYRLIGSFALSPFSAIYLKILPPTPLGEEGYSNCLRNIRISIKG